MRESRGELVTIDRNDDSGSNSISDTYAPTDSSWTKSVVAHSSDIWLTTVLAVALGILLLAFVVDLEPVVRYGIGLVVFALYLWWFVSTGVGVLDRLGD